MRVFSALLGLIIIPSGFAALLEPPDGQVYLGAWIATNDSTPGANDGDRPVKFNERMGWKAGVFQYAQNMPADVSCVTNHKGFPFPEEQIYATNTFALILLTVYCTNFDMPQAEIDSLVNQMQRLTVASKRQVIIRLSPEMNGNWNFYGQQPTRYIELWRRIVTSVRAKAPEVAFLWSPSHGEGYPYGVSTPPPADMALLDTNRDGEFNELDDPFLPFWPGDEYVDWVGISIYTYGSTFPWSDNIVAPSGKFVQQMTYGNFYETYCIQKNKPMAISETAAAFHLNTPLGPGVGELVTKQSWWQQYITNKQFWEQYPKVKLLCLFEFAKIEETYANGDNSYRDFRVSMNPEVRDAFNRDLEAVKSHYIFGDSEYLKQEAIKKGVNFNAVHSSPGSAVGGLPGSGAKHDGQIMKVAVSTIAAVLCVFFYTPFI